MDINWLNLYTTHEKSHHYIPIIPKSKSAIFYEIPLQTSTGSLLSKEVKDSAYEFETNVNQVFTTMMLFIDYNDYYQK